MQRPSHCVVVTGAYVKAGDFPARVVPYLVSVGGSRKHTLVEGEILV